MRYFQIHILFINLLLISTFAYSQQNIESYMIEIPTQKIHYEITEDKKHVTVNNFYISEFPESNKQYQKYLAELDSIEVLKALPETSYLGNIGLDEDQINFLVNEYYFSNEYYDFPVVGLNKTQIEQYLNWKTESIGKQILRDNKIQFEEKLSYPEAIKSLRIPKSIPIQANFLIPLEQHLISAKEYVKNNSIPTRKRNAKQKEKPVKAMLKKLQLSTIYAYPLKKDLKVDELILASEKGMDFEKMDINRLMSIKALNHKWKLDAENLLKPFRVWHIKY